VTFFEVIYLYLIDWYSVKYMTILSK